MFGLKLKILKFLGIQPKYNVLNIIIAVKENGTSGYNLTQVFSDYIPPYSIPSTITIVLLSLCASIITAAGN